MMRFGDLDIAFDSRLLRPRPWTLAQSRWAADLIRIAPEGRVLELCCGAGHIGLAAVRDDDRGLLCVDVDPTAAAFCLSNARSAGMQLRVDVRVGDLSSVLRPDERFAVVVADPPWVPASQTATFPKDPPLAIDGGPDGLDVARACLELVERHLLAGGSCVLQVGSPEQARSLGEWSQGRGVLELVEVRTHPRGTLARFDLSPASPPHGR